MIFFTAWLSRWVNGKWRFLFCRAAPYGIRRRPSLRWFFYHGIESAALLRVDPVTLTQKIKQSQNLIKPARGGAWRRVNGASARIQGRHRAPALLVWLGCPLETVGSVYAGGEPTRDCVLVTILAISTRRFGCLRKRLQSISFVASAMPFEEKLITFRGKQMPCIRWWIFLD